VREKDFELIISENEREYPGKCVLLQVKGCFALHFIRNMTNNF